MNKGFPFFIIFSMDKELNYIKSQLDKLAHQLPDRDKEGIMMLLEEIQQDLNEYFLLDNPQDLEQALMKSKELYEGILQHSTVHNYFVNNRN